MAQIVGIDSKRGTDVRQFAALGDKGQALSREIDAIITFCKAEGLEYKFFVNSKPRVFDEAMQRSVKEVLRKESIELDKASGCLPRGVQEFTRAAHSIVLNLILVALIDSDMVLPNGKPLSENSVCAALGQRRPQERIFRTVRDIREYDGHIGEYASRDANNLISGTYARIKDKLSQL